MQTWTSDPLATRPHHPQQRDGTTPSVPRLPYSSTARSVVEMRPYGVALRRPLHKLANACRTSSCNLWINLIGIRCSGRTRACAIAKNMKPGKADLLDNLECGIEFLIGFTWKSHDQITRKGDFGNVTADLSNESSRSSANRVCPYDEASRSNRIEGQMQKRGYTVGRLPMRLSRASETSIGSMEERRTCCTEVSRKMRSSSSSISTCASPEPSAS